MTLSWFLPYINMNQTGIHIPYPPSRLSQTTVLCSLCHRANSHQLSILHMVIYMSFNATISNHLTFPFPHCVHKSVLYVCVSTTALQIGSLLLLNLQIGSSYLWTSGLQQAILVGDILSVVNHDCHEIQCCPLLHGERITGSSTCIYVTSWTWPQTSLLLG